MTVAYNPIELFAAAEKKIAVGGFAVRDCSYEQARNVIFDCVRDRCKLAVFFANTHFVASCDALRSEFERHPAVYILNDGIGINLAAYLVHRHWFSQNLNGSDFVPRLLRDAQTPMRVFLLGGSPKAVAGAAQVLGTYSNVTIAGTCDGYSFWSEQEALIAAVNQSKADIVLVALGTPKQELWILENWRRIDAPVMFGIGALFDFLSNERPRAPLWVRRLSLEWLFRLCIEPRRLVHRYTIELFAFLRIVLTHGTAEAD
jgi:beta-1,4-glucosyltransferase